MNKFYRILSVLVLFSLFLAACTTPATPTQPPEVQPPAATQPPDTSQPEPTKAPEVVEPVAPEPAEPKVVKGTFQANDPRSIDPQRAIDTRDWALLTQIFSPLVITDIETGETLPGMATSWETSTDGTVFTFHLLEDVPWVRYNPETEAVEELMDDSGNVRYVTASDFVYGFLRALNPETGSPAAYMLAPYIVGAMDYNSGTGTADAVGLKAVDEYTFEITAPEQIGFALSIFSIINARATPEWAIDENGDSWTEPENIGTYGPFALKEWQHEATMTFIKNPFWPGSEGIQQPNVDEIVLSFVDEVVGLREYEAGSIDFTLVPGDQIVRIKTDANLSNDLTIVPGVCSQVWGFNTTKAPFDNMHIRRAFSYAIDRESLVTNVLAGGQIPSVFFTPPSIPMAPSATDASKGIDLFDVEKAKAELELGLQELGLSSADQLPPITAEFGTSAELSAVSQTLQSMWQTNLGIQVQLAQIDNTVYWSKQENDSGQIFRAGWCPDYNDPNNYLLDVYRSDSIYNYGKYTNPEYDRLVDEARVEPDPATRVNLYTQAETLMCVEESGIMPLYYPVRAQVTKPHVQRSFSTSGVEYFWEWDVTP